VNIIGVDFSGAKSDQNTWLAQGRLEDGALRLKECRPVSREDLTRLLAALVGPTVAALDFPFGVPQEFARCWLPHAQTMPDLWDAAAKMDLAGFIALRNEFVRGYGERKRRGDALFPECYSPLHQVNPNMVPMTFYGMAMLHQLWPGGWQVPPLEHQGPADRVLLEAMPGAALKAMGLPHKGYKNGKDRQRLREKRLQILDGLEERSGVPLRGLAGLREECLQHHDALDAVVAAVTAALWVRDPSAFRCPNPEAGDEIEASRLEGWLYAPVLLRHPRQQEPAPPLTRGGPRPPRAN
jgi:hypothetical protein